jgi:hypothetical protein
MPVMQIFLGDGKWHSSPSKCQTKTFTKAVRIGNCRSCGCQPDPPKEDFCSVCFPAINPKLTSLDYIRAHQYLYYVKANPFVSDYNYDMWGRDNCKEDYKGGSDNADDYTEKQKILAQLISARKTPPFP